MSEYDQHQSDSGFSTFRQGFGRGQSEKGIEIFDLTPKRRAIYVVLSLSIAVVIFKSLTSASQQQLTQ